MLLVNKSCECVYKRERNRSNRNVEATMPHNVTKQSSCVVLKDTNYSSSVYKFIQCLLSFLFCYSMGNSTVRRQGLHRGFSVGIFRIVIERYVNRFRPIM